MNNKPNNSIKRAQRESLLLREISKHLLTISIDDSRLHQISVNRVELSADKGVCIIYFYSPQGQSVYQELLPILSKYKPTLRKALAQGIDSRYTPNLAFEYDAQLEKQVRIEQLLDKVKSEDGQSE